MDISNYLRRVQEGVSNAAALADDDTKQVVARLGTSIESAVQLALIEALSDAAAEIGAELAPGSVGMSMQGLTPRFTVALPPATGEPTYLAPEEQPTEEGGEDADDTVVRFSLRLPKWAKDKADKRASEEGVSTNTWLAERVIRELSSRGRPGRPPFGGPFGGPPFGPPPFWGGRRGPEDRDGERGPEGDQRAERDREQSGEREESGAHKGPFDQADLGAMIDAASQAFRDWAGGKGGRHGRGPGGNVQGWV
ncbi:hypothetical protein [Cumulibacter manganitolerans]|uniref:hypothetical protein n=1 Tax=Cumulibacter manganitolerans TaxID=1884992 RepID=UPI001295ECCB|nr:hypothetical protein [Cumulibacter manganitolerans]